MLLALPLSLALGLLGQAEPQARDAEAAARLEAMKATVAAYDVRAADDRGTAFSLRPDPALRFANPVGDTLDGALFLWLGAGGRPMAAAQVTARRDGKWFHELTSLSAAPLVAESAGATAWRPARGGVEFRAVPGAPAPAATAEARSRQVRELARGFALEDEFHNQSRQPLRMLPRPLARYGKPGTDGLDGALFGYVMTTDPEVLLLLEARSGDAGPEWAFAFAPMTAYPVRATYRGREVWSLPDRYLRARDDPAEPFHVREVRPRD